MWSLLGTYMFSFSLKVDVLQGDVIYDMVDNADVEIVKSNLETEGPSAKGNITPQEKQATRKIIKLMFLKPKAHCIASNLLFIKPTISGLNFHVLKGNISKVEILGATEYKIVI